jgi:hypothetical protein
VNADGRTDVFAGGGRGQAGRLWVQTPGGGFHPARGAAAALAADAAAEDTACLLFDADGDGADELYVGSGGAGLPAASSALADRLYLNDGAGGLRRGPLPPPPPGGYRPTGAVAGADVDADGDLDLFVGAREVPFAYGLAAGGRLLLGDGRGGFAEATAERAPQLASLSMVTAAGWGDLDGDGRPELAVASEWAPLRVFRNRGGRLEEATAAAGLAGRRGLWQSLALADLDADGDLDLLAGNHGLNSRLRASRAAPLRLWAGDLDRNGSFEELWARTGPDGRAYPLALRHELAGRLPGLAGRWPSYASYAGRSVAELLGGGRLGEALARRADWLASSVGWNDGTGRFRLRALPLSAQLAPLFALGVGELDGAGGPPELVLGGNLHAAQPKLGRYDASLGSVLALRPAASSAPAASDDSASASAPAYLPVAAARSGLASPAQLRDIEILTTSVGRFLLISQNDDSLKVYKID